MPKLSAVVRDRAEISIPLEDDESLNIVYRPSKVTTEVQEILEALNTAGRQQQERQRRRLDGVADGDEPPAPPDPAVAGLNSRSIYAPLAEALISWDLLDDDNEAFPTTEDGLRRVPLQVLGLVFAVIVGDNRPNLRTSPRSTDGSSEQQSPATSAPTGTAASS